MALCFLLDEHLRGPLWWAIQQHNGQAVDVLNVLRVGDPPAPPLGIADPDLLLWCEANGRTLVSQDYHTMPAELAAHVAAGGHLPGLLLLRSKWKIPEVIDALVLHDQAYDPVDLIDQVVYIP
jgi:hypothetical protein